MPRLPKRPQPWSPPTAEDRERQQIGAEGRAERARMRREHLLQREERARRQILADEEAERARMRVEERR